MLWWTPSGLFSAHPALNYPFQFLSQMDSVPAMAATMDSLKNIPPHYSQFGYWWGNCNIYMTGWDNGSWDVLDPSNPTHRQAAMHQLAMARDLGATLIGLDAYAYLKPRQAQEWLLEMQDSCPGVTFVTEGMRADYLHRLAPSWCDGVNVDSFPYMADFLLQEHETWAGVRADLQDDTTDAIPWWDPRNYPYFENMLRHYGDMGYAPLIWLGLTLSSPVEGRSSYTRSLPADLQPLCPARVARAGAQPSPSRWPRVTVRSGALILRSSGDASGRWTVRVLSLAGRLERCAQVRLSSLPAAEVRIPLADLARGTHILALQSGPVRRSVRIDLTQ
jgi:hypothetical protein